MLLTIAALDNFDGGFAVAPDAVMALFGSSGVGEKISSHFEGIGGP